MSVLLSWAGALEQTSFSTWIAESRYAFPILEGVHLIALSLSVGLVFLMDLRLAGFVFRQIPVSRVLSSVRPYALGGFALVFVTGSILFCAEASAVLESPATPFKFAFMALAGLNALYFERVVAKDPALAESSLAPPRAARLAGLTSLGLWTLVIVCGRLIAYIPHWS